MNIEQCAVHTDPFNIVTDLTCNKKNFFLTIQYCYNFAFLFSGSHYKNNDCLRKASNHVITVLLYFNNIYLNFCFQ